MFRPLLINYPTISFETCQAAALSGPDGTRRWSTHRSCAPTLTNVQLEIGRSRRESGLRPSWLAAYAEVAATVIPPPIASSQLCTIWPLSWLRSPGGGGDRL